MGKYAVYKIFHLLLVLVLISRSLAIPVRSKRSNVQDLPLLHEDYDGDDYGTDNSRDPIVDDGTSHLSPLDERGGAHIQGHVEYIDNLHGNRSDNGDPTGSSYDLGSDGNVRDIDIDNIPNGQSEPNLEPDISRGETLNENIPDEHIDSDNGNVQSQSGLPNSRNDNHNSSSAQQDRGETFSTTRPNGDGQYVINAVGRAVHTVNASMLGEQQSEHIPHTSNIVSTNTPGDRQNPHGFLMGGQVMDTTSEGYRAQHGFLMGGDIQNVDNEHNSNTLTTKLPTSPHTTTLSSSTTPTPEPFITVRLSNMSSHELTESSSPVRTYNNDIVIDRTDQSNGRRGDTDNAQLAGQVNSHDTDKDSTTELPLTSEGQVATLPSREPNVHEHGHENDGHLNGHGETVGNGNGIDVPIDKGEHPHNGNSEENNEPGHPRHTINPVARTPDRQDNLPVTEFVMTTPNRIILPTPANLEPEERDISSSIHEPQSTVTVHNGESEHIEPSNEGPVNPGESGESGNQGNNGQSNNSEETHATTSEGHIEFVTELPEIFGDNAFKPNKNLPKDSDRKSGDMPLLSLSTTSTSVTENHFPASSSIPGSAYENSVHNPTDKTVQTMDILHSSTVTYSERKHTCIQTGNMLCPARSISATREQLFPSNSVTHVQFTDAFQSVRVGLEETTPVLLFETSTTHQPHVIPKNTRTSLPDQFIIPTNSIFPTKTVDENIDSQSIERSIAVPAESIVPTQSSRHVGSSITKHSNNDIDGSPSITSSMPQLVPTSSEALHTSAHASQIHSSTDTSRHDSPVYSSTGTTVVQSSLENVLQTQYMSSEAIHANTDHGLPVVSSMPVQSSQELTPQVVLTTTSAHQSPQSSVTFPMLTSNPTTKKKVEHSTTPAASTSHSTQKKPNSDKEPDKPNIVGGSSSSSVSSTTTTTTTSSPHILSTTLPTSTARPATTQKLETSTQPSVYIEIRLKMGWSQFRTSKIEFIAGIREIILSEKGYIVDDEQFVLSTEDGPSSMEGENIQIITIKMYFVDNDGKLDILLTTETPSFILKGFHQSNFLKDKLVSVHTVNRKPPELLPEARPERRREPPNVTMVIVLASMGGVCCVALIILQVLIHRRVKSKRKQRQFIGHRASLQSMDHVALGVIPKSRPSSGYWNPALDDTLELPEPEEHSHILNFSGLANFCMDNKAIYSEFQEIPHDDVESSSIPIGEEDKNRFANVLPHKHNRVYLNKTQENKSGYINANYVDGYMGEKKVYIATQSPMVNTVDDFWRMVWEQQTRTILMLNPMTSQGKPKQSTCYWPDNLETDNQREFQDYIVTLKKRDVQQDYVDCTLEIIDIEKNLKREIHHFWFTCWSDTGPPEPLTFVKFVLDTRPHYENSGSPALVHCGPGTGRTGTFIAVDICMRMFEDRRRVDIQSCVHKLRGERAGAVQTKEQYFLIYQALNEYAVILSSPSISTRSSVITLHAML